MAKKEKEKIVVLEPEVVDELADPGYDFKEVSRKKPRGTRMKDFPLFTPKRIEEILKIAEIGTPTDLVAKEAGISPSTLKNWLSRGEIAQQQLEKGEDDLALIERAFAQFYVDYGQATAIAVNGILINLMAKAKENPYVALKLIEKLQPELFGPKQQLDVRSHTIEERRGSLVVIDGREKAKEMSDGQLKFLLADINNKELASDVDEED